MKKEKNFPWHKGKKTGIIPKSAFKKGQIPHNKKIWDYKEIRNLYQSGLSANKIAVLKNVSKKTILRILHNIGQHMRTGKVTQFKKGQIPHNKKEKIKLFCSICQKEYFLKPSAAIRVGDKGRYKTKYCSVKCRRDSFKFNDDLKRKATENIIKYLKSSKKGRTKPEIMLKEQLINLGLKEGEDFFEQYKIGNYLVDFSFPNQKIVLEADGDYPHVNPLKFPYDIKTFINTKKINS